MPTPIDYATFLLNANNADVAALATLASGTVVATPDPVEAEAYRQQGQRLYDAGLLIRFRIGQEERSGATWYTYDAILSPTALNYVAQCASERLILSREPLPTT